MSFPAVAAADTIHSNAALTFVDTAIGVDGDCAMLRLLETLFGPVFLKEMLEISRRRRSYALRVAYVAVLLAIAYGIWREPVSIGPGGLGIREMARMGGQLFHRICIAQILVIHALLPLFLAGCICDERQSGSLDLLLISPLTEWEILVGKLGSRIMAMLLIVASSLPFLSIAMLFGGIDPGLLWITEAITLGMIFYLAGMSLYYSTVCATRQGALLRIYGWIVSGLFVLPILAVTLIPLFRSAERHVIAALALLFMALMGLAELRSAANALERERGGDRIPNPRPAPPKTPVPQRPAGTQVPEPARVGPPRRTPFVDDAPAELLVDGLCRVNYGRRRGGLGFADPVLGCLAVIALAMFGPLALISFVIFANAFVVGWFVLAVVGATYAGTNPVFVRSGSVRDVILMAPLEPDELLRAGLRGMIDPLHTIWNLSLLVLAMRLLVNPLGTLLVAPIAVLFLLLSMLAGSLGCLVARTRLEATFCSLAFPLTMFGGLPLLHWISPGLTDPLAIGMTLLAPLLVGLLTAADRREVTTARTLALFGAIHLSLLAFFVLAPAMVLNDTAWSASHLSPGYWILAASAAPNWFTGSAFLPFSPILMTQVAGYLAALAINIAIVAWWIRADFDRLVDRPHRTPRNPEPSNAALVVEQAP